jgi:hypothetical protein
MLSPLSISPSATADRHGRGCHPSREKNFVTPLDLPSRGEGLEPLSPLLPREKGTGEDVSPLDLPSRGEEIESFSFVG